MTTTKLHRSPDRVLHHAAVAAAGTYIGFAVLQLALAFGASFGDHVWGGALSEVLPLGWRMASGVAAVALVWMALVVLARATIIQWAPIARRYLGLATWSIAALTALNTVGNLASTSALEQQVFAPVTAVLAVLTAVVARRG